MKKIALALAIAAASTLMAADGAALYKKCAACHGAKAEKKALNKGQIIQGWDAAKIEASLKGYKDGTYGGAMKGLMKGQVMRYNNTQIKALATHIHGL
jgi:cytochrome c553